jgi:hypothetical protein
VFLHQVETQDDQYGGDISACGRKNYTLSKLNEFGHKTRDRDR